MSSGNQTGPKCLVVTADKHPSYRVDLVELLGHQLHTIGYRFDWLLQSSSSESLSEEPWTGGTSWVGPTSNGNSAFGRVYRQLLGILHDLRLIGLARRNHYDCLIIKDKFFAAALAHLTLRFHGTPFVYWLSFPFAESARYKAQQRGRFAAWLGAAQCWAMDLILYKVVAKHAQHVMVQSEWMKRDLVSKGMPEAMMTAVPMGVSLERMPLSNAEPDSLRAIYIGSLGKARRVDMLLRAFKLVEQAIPDAQLELVGGAHHQRDIDELKALSASLGLENSVHFCGFLDPQDTWDRVRNSLFGVSAIPPTPEFWVSSPTKLVEYMALNRAVVANDLPDQQFVLNESKGGLCVSYDEKQIADAMIQLFSDPKGASKMGSDGYAWIAKHRTYNKIAKVVDKLLTEAIQPTTRSSGKH